LEALMRTSVLLMLLMSSAVTSAEARSLRVSGTTGYLSEWELAGDLPSAVSGFVGEFSGPVIFRHVGLCSANGPEEKPGEIKLQISKAGSASEIRATLIMAGTKCTFGGQFNAGYSGAMNCDDAKGVPLTISLQ
jgi:hypothetical protein